MGAARCSTTRCPPPIPAADRAAIAAKVVEGFQATKQIIPGIGHPFHKPIDPRTPRLFQIAKETGFDGPYLQLVIAIADEAGKKSGKVLPVNATGAIGALCCAMGFDWKICRGLGVMARAVGLVGHILEESRRPMAAQVWQSVEAQATATSRKPRSNVPPMKLDLQGKSVIITGGGSNIGRAIVLAFAAEGAHITIGDVDEGQATKTAELARTLGAASVEVIKTDVTSLDQVEAMFAAAVKKTRPGRRAVARSRSDSSADRASPDRSRRRTRPHRSAARSPGLRRPGAVRPCSH